MRAIEEIIVHCADSRGDVDAATIRKWHVEERGWRDIGYHYVIRKSGNLEMGRPVSEIGAHVAGHNRYSIGICLAGGYQGAVDYTIEQMLTLEILIRGLSDKYPQARIAGHCDFDSGKTCPNFDVSQWWNGINS